jgi:hypothetical protein
VLLVLALVVLDLLARTRFGPAGQWVVGILLVVGVLAQSGGTVVHMGVGKPGRWSVGNTLTTVCARLLARALLTTDHRGRGDRPVTSPSGLQDRRASRAAGRGPDRGARESLTLRRRAQ